MNTGNTQVIAILEQFQYRLLMRVENIPNFEELTDMERLQLAEELIASIRHPEALPAPVNHRLELERRWAEFERNPSSGLSEEQFWVQVRARKR